MSERQFVIGMVILLASLGLARAAGPHPTPEQIRAFGYLPRGTEITQLDDACSRHFSNGDGTITARIVAGGRRAQDSSALDDVGTIVGFHSGFAELSDEGNTDYVDSLIYPFIASGMWLGLFNLREAGWEEWPTTSIPSGSTVTAVCCSLRYFPSTSGLPAPSQVPIYDMGPIEPSSYRNNPNGHYTDATTGRNYGSFTGMGTTQVWVWTMLDSLARNDLQSALSRGWWGVGVAPYGDVEEAEFRSHQFSTPSQRPRLIVTYTPPGGVPDISVQRFLAPPASVDSGVAQVVKATIKNVGTVAASGISAGFRISGTVPYSSGRTGISLGVGETTDVTFDPWVPARVGTFTTRCTVHVAGDVNRMNDTLNGSVSVQYRDVGCTQILQPAGTIDSGAPVAPRVKVRNYGTDFASFVVACSLGTYSNTQTADEVPAGSEVSITFPLPYWQPRRGTYGVKFYTMFPTDLNHANDTIRGTVTVNVTDVGCDQILAPAGDLDSTGPMSPQAVVRNYGNTNTPAFNAVFTIGSYSSTKQVPTLLPGAQATVTFDSPQWGCPRGIYSGTCVTQLSGDLNPSNDSKSTSGFVRVTDVGCDRILAPAGDLDSVGALSPVAKVQNYGNTDVTTPFNVLFSIGSWSGAKQVSSLNAGDSAILTFDAPSWGCPRGPYAGTCSTQMNGDRNPNDDAKTTGGFVRVTDVGCDRILAPAGDLDSVGALSPVAKVQNYGNTNVTTPFDVGFAIGNWSGTKQVSSLNAGDSAILTFDAPSWGCPRGQYSATCSTRMGGDRIPGDNAKASSGTVNVSDVGATAIVEPYGSDTAGVPVTPRVRAQNFGTADATCDLRLLILGPAREVLYDHIETGVLVPVSGPIVRGFSVQWTPTITGRCSLWAFTVLTSDVNHANDTTRGSCLVRNPVVHDVATLTIVAPTGTVDTMPRVPQAEVKNLGEVAETFLAWYRILDPTGSEVYYDSARATDLAPNAELVLGFRVWLGHHPLGAYLARCSTALAGDMRPENNAVQDTFTVALLGPALWNRVTDVLPGGKRKNVKDGACLASARETGDDTSYVYAFKGNNTCEFYRYNAGRNEWSTRDSIPAVGRLLKKKGVRKGATLVQAGNGRLCAAKGNNTYDWWQYVPGVGGQGRGFWVQREDVPIGSRAVREGTGSVAVVENGGNFVYLLKGSGTYEFYRYDADNGTWQTMADAPAGNSHKPFKNGSCLTYDGSDTIYCLKGSYNEFFAYSISGRTWATRDTLPRVYPPGTSKKKVKDGAGIAAVGRTVYALKGANTNEFWGYDCNQHRWNPLTQMPLGTKRVKGGGALVYVTGAYSLYAFRGNNTREFWSYGPVTADRYPFSADPEPKDVQGTAGGDVRTAELRVFPNPFRASISPGVYYSLPVAGDVSLGLYDVSGKLVSVLASGYRPAGSYRAELTANGSQQKLAAGIYVLRLGRDGRNRTQKLIIE